MSKKAALVLLVAVLALMVAPVTFAQAAASSAGDDELGWRRGGDCAGNCGGGLRHRSGTGDSGGLRRHGA